MTTYFVRMTAEEMNALDAVAEYLTDELNDLEGAEDPENHIANSVIQLQLFLWNLECNMQALDHHREKLPEGAHTSIVRNDKDEPVLIQTDDVKRMRIEVE